MESVREYGKAVAAVVTALIVTVYQVRTGDHTITRAEWVHIAVAGVTAVGVYVVPLAPQARWSKTAVAAILAGLQVLSTVILGPIGVNEVLLILITVAGAIGVWVAPAKSTGPNGTVVQVRAGSDA